MYLMLFPNCGKIEFPAIKSGVAGAGRFGLIKPKELTLRDLIIG